MTTHLDKKQFDEQIEIAISLQKSGEFEKAKLIYEFLLKIKPNAFQILYLLGTLEAQCCNFDKSLIYLIRANNINSNSWEVNYNIGNAYFEINEFKKAIKYYDKAIKINSNNSIQFYYRGFAYKRLENYANALPNFEKALSIDPNNISAHFELAISQAKLKNFEKAFENFKKLIVINPSNPEFYFQYGVALFLSENYVNAISCLEIAVSLKTDFAAAYLILGDAFRAFNKNPEAIENYKKSISYDNKNDLAYYNLGHLLVECKKFKEALYNLEKVITLNPKFDQAYSGIGVVYINLGQQELAYEKLSKAIELNSLDPTYYLNRGNVLSNLRRFNESLLDYDKAIELKSDFAQAYCNRGYVLLNYLFKPEAAKILFDVAIALDPNLTIAFVNRAECFVRLNEFEKALDDFLRALEMDPESEFTLGKCLHYKMKICDWDNLAEGISICESMIEGRKLTAVPFETLHFSDKPDLHLSSAKLFNNQRTSNANILGKIENNKDKHIIKVAYFSADLYNHPVSIWLTEQLENHDRTKVELFAFCLKSVQDSMRDRLEATFDHWIDVQSMSDLEIAKLSRELGIDIAIDLNGHTADGRVGIFAARAAPIQMNHIGFPGSMGAEYIDYMFGQTLGSEENVEDWASSRPFITEKIAYVPSMFTYDRQRQISDEPLTRAQYGLPEKGFVFTCQNGCQKLTPEVFDVWMEILKAVPGSVLWLLKPSDLATSNLIKEALARGVDSERLVFTAREVVSMDQEKARTGRYLAGYRLADLFLDTWPYNAGTTAVDALWAGLPVLTKKGKALVARMATEALRGIEVPELITKTPEEYKELAIELAHNPEKLKQLKDKVQRNRLTTSLFDPVANTRHIENAYLEMYRRYAAGEQPNDFIVQP
jgi:predicted O-linked N-acetylglucosamine transferase (SPINDLY family)